MDLLSRFIFLNSSFLIPLFSLNVCRRLSLPSVYNNTAFPCYLESAAAILGIYLRDKAGKIPGGGMFRKIEHKRQLSFDGKMLKRIFCRYQKHV